VEDLVDLLVDGSYQVSGFEVRYDQHIEDLLEGLCIDPDCRTGKFPKRGALLKLLEGNRFFAEQFSDAFKEKVRHATVRFNQSHSEDIEVDINRDRYDEAGRIANDVISNRIPPRKLSERVSDATLRPHTGIPILFAVLGGMFLVIVFVGGFVEEALIDIYNVIVGDFFFNLAEWIGGTLGGAIAEGINLAFQAILAIVIPYIMLFYLMLGMMEDSGYMPRVVVLLDGVMHRIGLHGRAVIPMIVGMGCNVPAILSTRVLESRRERLILAIVIVIAIPCSAQTAVIMGTVGKFAGAIWALGIYVILIAILLVLGRILHRFLFKFEPTSLAMEIPELTWPRPKNVLWKTWVRSKDFFVVAFPILLVGSIVLEILMAYGVLQALVEPLAPFTEGFLGLPPITIVALIFGILRKEMALQMLVVLFGTANLALVMTPEQLFIFALIMATYLPCLSALLVLSREFGWKDALMISVASVTFAFLLGGLFNALFQVF
jgi:ferrous iron transport protein B